MPSEKVHGDGPASPGTSPPPDSAPTGPGKTEPVVKGIGAVVAIGGAISTIIGLISDVLIPVAWLPPAIAIVSGLLLLPSVVGVMRPTQIAGAKWLGSIHHTGQQLLGAYWGKPAVAALTCTLVVSVAAAAITGNAPPGGFVGSQVPAVHDLQTNLGLIQADTARIADNTQAIKDATQAIKDTTQQINQQVGDLKKETSGDPRKELANLGVEWTTRAFVEALKTSDARTVKLFLAGGMSPTTLDRDTSAALYPLQAGLPNPIPMLQVMIDNGFDPDTILVDNGEPPMTNYGYGFQSTDEKVIVWTQFRGPALLWLVVQRCYLTQDPADVKVVHFLIDHGADTTVTKAFLDHIWSYMGDYPACQDMRTAVFGP